MPSLVFEMAATAETGAALIAGLDEAGRGAIAGPVTAAAVILPLNNHRLLARLSRVDDSKKLTAKVREQAFDEIVQVALTFGIASASAVEIDQHGIIGATKLAMSRAVALLEPPPECLLIDGRIKLRQSALPQQSLVKGDTKSLTIAAASILAKVTRDRVMVAFHQQYPEYGFAKHKGYCTKQHEAAVFAVGPCAIHRRTFAPVRLRLIK